MQEEKVHQKNYPRQIARILLKIILFVMLFIVVLFLLILTPPAQRFMTGKVENYLEKKLKTKVEIESISFGLSGNLELQNIYMEDQQKDTLLYGGSIKANVSLLKLFSNEVQVKDIELQNIYANIKRTLPDTAFNFQFVVDAFMADRKKNPDTAQTAPLKLNVSDLSLEKVRFRYNDVVTGSDMFANIGNFSAAIQSIDPDSLRFDIPSVIGRNIYAVIKQHKPLLQAANTQVDEPTAIIPFIKLGTLDFTKLNVQFENNVSSFYSKLNIGRLLAEGKNIDLKNNILHLDHLELNNATSSILLGKSAGAKIAEQKIEKKLEVEGRKGWTIRMDKIALNNNALKFDNDNKALLSYGMDYAHLDAKELNLQADDLIFSTDSIGANISKGSFREKSGFVLNELRGNILYAYNQTYLKDLYIKTPGSEVKRNASLEYASFEDLVNHFEHTVMNIEIENSRVQVKDILVFAPQLRNNAAFRDPSAIWDLNIIGNGTLNQLNIETLQFTGLRNTIINANGTLTGLMNPKTAGGNFTIHQLKTSQSDLALFTGQRLSTPEVNLPENFSLAGTIRGNAGQLYTNVRINSSAGSATVNGSFSDLVNPERIRYNAKIQATGLALGSILRQQGTIGNLTGNFSFNGTGMTPNSISTKFTGNISSLEYNRYRYRNIKLSGNLKKQSFSTKLDINDPNADLDMVISGNMGTSTSFRIDGMVDSIKTMPLHFTPGPLVFRGQVNGNVANLNPDYLDADLLITRALLVSNEDRLPLDTIEFISGHTDTSNYLRFSSDVANASLEGQYRISELGSIIQSTIQPYFLVTPPSEAPRLHPYNFRFSANVFYSPIYANFIPGFTGMDPLHAEGSFATGQGMNAVITTPHLSLQGNQVSDLNVNVQTTSKGLEVRAIAGHLQSGSFNVYNTRLNATALNNVIDFNVGIDDAAARNKYFLSGLIRQPLQSVYAISLRPDSLMLNYEMWTVDANNQITISPNSIGASNFILQRGEQRLSIASMPGKGQQPLEVSFNAFRLSTITGFIKSDTLIADGLMNGRIVFQDLTKQPAFTSNLTISDFSMQQDTLGNLQLVVNTGAGNRYNTNLTLLGRGNDVSIDGYFTPAGSGLDLNLDLNIRKLDLATVEGASSKMLTNASGFINGQVKIQGNTSSPMIRGDVNFNKASFAMTLLGSQFYIDNEKLSVSENGLRLDNFTIRDSANNQLIVNGDILTKNYSNYQFALTVEADNFLILNSVRQKESLYYGRLNISSDLRVNGTELNPIIDGTITVNDGTALSIVVPQPQPGIQQREGIVQFVNMQHPEMDTLFTSYDSLNFANVLGMDIAANIEVKKEAILNVIIDEANGDFLNVQGEALITAGVDPSGKITLVGNYTLVQGSYEISFDLLRRKFDITKGSTITWTGEPTTARLDVNAVYIANTAPLDLVQDQIAASNIAIRNTYLQKLPFEVKLNLQGELLKPEISFDIVLPENKNYGVSNDIVTIVQSRLSQLRADEGDMNKQVFSLLLLGRFVGENPFESSGEGFEFSTYARQSVSKLLTEQLNSLAAGLVGGVEIDFDVASTDDYTTGERRSRTDLNVGLSKKLLNDRLKISVGSNFQLEGPQNSNQQNNNIAGNVAIDYQLSKDGRYLIRFFRRNQYEGVVDGYIIENGLSFILSVDYNRFREILKRKKQKVTRTGTIETPAGQ